MLRPRQELSPNPPPSRSASWPGPNATEFYVYELRDPRNGLPFYVGKGKGDRINAHEREARKGVSSPKCERIKEIWAAGLQAVG